MSALNKALAKVIAAIATPIVYLVIYGSPFRRQFEFTRGER